MSRATSVTLRLSVRTPIPAPATVTAGFDPATVGGWAVASSSTADEDSVVFLRSF